MIVFEKYISKANWNTFQEGVLDVSNHQYRRWFLCELRRKDGVVVESIILKENLIRRVRRFIRSRFNAKRHYGEYWTITELPDKPWEDPRRDISTVTGGYTRDSD